MFKIHETNNTKEIKIFECYRTLLYSPIYHVVKFPKKHKLTENITFNFGDNDNGDLNAFNAMAGTQLGNGDKYIFPIAVCDPFVNIKHGNLDNSAVRLISTLIDRIAVWVVGIRFENADTDNEIEHNTSIDELKKDSDLETFLATINREKKTIFYPEEAFSTSNMVNSFFMSLPSGYRKKKSNLLLNPKSELDLLQQGNLVLTNNPWVIEDILSRNRIDSEKYKLEIIRDFGPMYIPFTGIITKNDCLSLEIKENPVDNFIDEIGKACETLYSDTTSFITDMASLGSAFFNLEINGDYFHSLVGKSIRHLAQRRIYNRHSLTSFFAWDYAEKKIFNQNDLNVSKEHYNSFIENHLNEKYLCKNHLLID